MKSSTFLRLFAVVGVIVLLSSCSIFRKKNRCNTCPTWNDNVELTAENTDAGVDE